EVVGAHSFTINGHWRELDPRSPRDHQGAEIGGGLHQEGATCWHNGANGNPQSSLPPLHDQYVVCWKARSRAHSEPLLKVEKSAQRCALPGRGASKNARAGPS